MSVHLCWVLVGVVVLCFFALGRDDSVSASGVVDIDPWPLFMFLLAVICVLLICILHMAIC